MFASFTICQFHFDCETEPAKKQLTSCSSEVKNLNPDVSLSTTQSRFVGLVV